MTAGRPSPYDPEFHPVEIVEMGKKGYHVYQMSTAFGITRDTLYAWAIKHPEFSDAFIYAREEAKKWALDMNMRSITDNSINPYALKMHTKFLMDSKDLEPDLFVQIKNFNDSPCYKHKLQCIINALGNGDINCKQAEAVMKVIEGAVRCEQTHTDISGLLTDLKIGIDKITNRG